MKRRVFTKKSEQLKRSLLRNNMTNAEKLLWFQLKNRKLGLRFLRQYSIEKFVVDFYCPEVKLAIEVDGITHNTPEEIEYDTYRQVEIEKYKITFARFTNHQIYGNIEHVIDAIKARINVLKKNN
jgi:very-short-patch-repair endonuclease